MKKTILKKDRRGFTLAELLAVILILVILIGLGVPGFIALRRNIKIAEYDDIAREIYLAAQNQLTRLSANGMDKSTETELINSAELPFTEAPSDFDVSTGVTWDSTEYRYANQGTDCMNLLLPLGGVSEDIRTNGFYTIEYNVKTYTVYGVFYSEKKFTYYDEVNLPGFRTSRDVRKDPMVGYYGGSAVTQNPQDYCETPQLEIINENRLLLNILHIPEGVSIAVSVSDGTKLVDAKDMLAIGTLPNSRILLMDSVFKNEARFHELFPELTPGSDLTITVTYSKPGCLPSSAAVETNSLFATRELGAGEGEDVVTIAWARHLQNLERSFSNLSDENIATARQTAHIEWLQTDFGDFTSIRNQDETQEYNKKLLRYEGSNLEIRGLTGSNGLFAQTKESMVLSGIRLVNPDIHTPATNTEPVGALVGTAKQGTNIASCGVYYRKTNDADDTVDYDAYQNLGIHNESDTPTGGLVGKAEQTNVNSSFAALPVIEAKKGAGLIGEAKDCTITKSYSNCDSLPISNFQYFIDGTGNTVDNSYAVGNVADKKTAKFAGNNGNTVTNSYYAVSHKDFGTNKDLAATDFYYMGGNGSWKKTNQTGMTAAVASGWASTGGWKTLTAPVSHPYREYLDGRAYPYPAIADTSLGAMDHYGSWPDGDGTVKLTIDMKLLNSKDNAKNAGRVIVTVPGTGNTTETIYNSDDLTNFPTNVIDIALGTEITVRVETNNGYAYVRTTVTHYGNSTQEENQYVINRDTTVTVYFRQETFKLNCHYAQDENNATIQNAQYLVDLTSPAGTVNVIGTSGQSFVMRDVETGSKVVVRPSHAQSYAAVVVYYVVDGTRTYITQGEKGYFTFDMPAADTDLHVIYTKDVVKYNIRYHLMDTEGTYQLEGDPKPYSYGVGAQINHSMISAMAESSGLPLTIDGEQVRYFARGVVKNGEETIFETNIDPDGKVTAGAPYVTTSADKDKTFQVDIYIARREYNVTLIAGGHISSVQFAGDDAAGKQVTKKVFYGADVTAVAAEELGYQFTFWDPQDTRFMMSANKRYTFTVPHFDLTLTASAQMGRYLVTINLEEDDESWLYSSASRKADPIRLTLVNSKTKEEFPMNALTEDSISYAMQAVVPAVTEYGEGYHIRVDYDYKPATWIYSAGGEETDDNNTKLLIQVRGRAVEETVKFYSVTYHAVIKNYTGAPPKGGTFPMYYHLTVEGNSGYLRENASNPRFFSGWKDAETVGTGSDTVFTGSEILMITRRTDMFAQWTEHFSVKYDGNGAEGGTLPVDNHEYQPNDTVTVKFGDLTRKGYTFLGWSTDPEATEAAYSKGKVEQFTLESTPVTLYAVWQLEEYTVQFYDHLGEPLTGKDYTFEKLNYGAALTAPSFTVNLDGQEKQIVGWSLTQNGDIAYHVFDTITITGDMTLYACLADDSVAVMYWSMNGGEWYTSQSFGVGVSSYLNFVPTIDQVTMPVVAWSTEPNGKGTLYLCREDGRSVDPVAFTEDINLYAVYGKVYNYQQQMWFDTLGEAVESPVAAAGDTLIVYRNTQETKQIVFDKDLYVIASGNRRVMWQEGSAPMPTGEVKENQFTGCMRVFNDKAPVTLTFGKSDVSTLSMDGSSLTFDANEQNRVISLGGMENQKVVFNMYDGITLTNGNVVDDTRQPEYENQPDENSVNANDDKEWVKAHYGGGLYAGMETTFNMYGGTISHCTAYKGGGVYLFANKNSVNLNGSKMQMGNMVTPSVYSATAIYYTKDSDGFYKNAGVKVTAENYKKYFVAVGNPQICYNRSTRKFEGNWSCDDGGGGLLMLDLKDGDLVLYKGSIHNNTAHANGGGIVTDAGDTKGTVSISANVSKLRIYEVDISHNTAYGYGGGIFQWQGIVYIYNSTLRQNYAKKSGGGVYLHHFDGSEKSDIQFHYGDIADNHAKENGGGVYVENELKMEITHGNLVRNQANGNGGGAYVQGSTGLLELAGGTVAANHAKGDGGGVYSGGIVNVKGGTMSGNTANNAGGIFNNGTVTMSGGILCDNEARYLGGGIMNYANLNLSGGSLYGNTDTDYQDALPDEDNQTESPNDIYLVDDKTITVPAGGIALGGESRVTVDCDRDVTQRSSSYQLPRKVVTYADAGNYKPEDALYFTYYGTRSTEKYKGLENHGPDLHVLPYGQIDPNLPVGLYLSDILEGDTRTVTLNANFGETPEQTTKVGQVGKTILLQGDGGISVFEREGYYIAGWARTPDALEEDYVMLYDPVAAKWRSGYQKATAQWTVESDTPDYTVQDYFSQTLYAMWKPCVVVYELQERAWENGVTIQPTSVGPSVTLMNPDPVEYTVDGKTYHFMGWSLEPARNEVKYQATQRLNLTENLRLYDAWEERKENSVYVTLWYNGGSSTVQGELGRVFTVDKDGEFQLPNTEELTITRSGKVLLGWSSGETATKAEHASGTTLSNLVSDVTLYAVWADAVNLTFDYNYEGSPQPITHTLVRNGEYTITENENPSRPYFKFLGWATTPTTVTTDTKYLVGEKFGPVNSDTKLYAQWERLTWTLTLVDYDGKETATSGNRGEAILLTKPADQEGYKFLGWSKKADGEIAYGPEAADVPYKDEFVDSLKLYAVWKKQHKVEFVVGAVSDEVTIPEGQLVTEGESITLPKVEWNGHVFSGWTTNPDSKDVEYHAGDLFKPEGEAKLYAVWDANLSYVSDPSSPGEEQPSAGDPTPPTADPPAADPSEPPETDPPETQPTEPQETKPVAETAPEAVPATEPPKPSEPEAEPEPSTESEPSTEPESQPKSEPAVDG